MRGYPQAWRSKMLFCLLWVSACWTRYLAGSGLLYVILRGRLIRTVLWTLASRQVMSGDSGMGTRATGAGSMVG
jgi:hypothetical protein